MSIGILLKLFITGLVLIGALGICTVGKPWNKYVGIVFGVYAVSALLLLLWFVIPNE